MGKIFIFCSIIFLWESYRKKFKFYFLLEFLSDCSLCLVQTYICSAVLFLVGAPALHALEMRINCFEMLLF